MPGPTILPIPFIAAYKAITDSRYNQKKLLSYNNSAKVEIKYSNIIPVQVLHNSYKFIVKPCKSIDLKVSQYKNILR